MLRALVDTWREALRSLTANTLRSALTLLGIVIGVTAVVAMASTTEGLRRKVDADLAMLGDGVFQVQKWPLGFGSGERARFERRKNLTLADVALVEQKCRECLRVGGEAWTFGQELSAGERSTRKRAQIAGGTAAFFDNNGYALARGRFFDEGEALGGADVVVLGADVVDVLFPDADPLGRRLRLGDRAFRVIGTIERRGAQLGGGSSDSLVVVPLTRFLELFGARQSLNITIQARDPARMGRAQDEVVALLRRARGVPPEADNDFEMFSNQSVQESFREIAGSIAAASIGICAIALLIGGIGVMNIMLVAVTERTGEIGLRRALGARRRRILGQFVVEAVALTSTGGALGVLVGVGVALLVKTLVGLPAVIPLWAVALSMLSAGGTGLVFGIYPAVRASRLDPVEAMRRE